MLKEIKERIRYEHAVLVFIFLLVIAFRLFFALQTGEYSSSESYAVLRQVESIRTTGIPLYEDPLSYGGRTLTFLPLFHYLLAGLSAIFPEIIAFKVIPNILASTIVLITYLICRDFTKNREASLVAAFLSGFVPVYITETANSLSVYSIIVPLTFLLLYSFQLLHKDQHSVPLLLFCLSLLAFLHANVFLVIMGLLFYLLLVKMEKLESSRAETEVVLFATVFVTWLNFIFSKKMLLAHGPAVVWQNIPPQLLYQFFTEFNLVEAVSLIGLLPFIFGLYAGYKHLMVERKRVVILYIGFALAVFSLLGMRLIPLSVGLIYLGITLVLLFGQCYKLMLVTISKSKFEPYGHWIRITLLGVILITGLLPSATYALEKLDQAPSREEMAAFTWLRTMTPEDAVVLSTLNEGHYITALAKRRNVMDNNFILIPDAAERLEDIDSIYTAHSQTEAIRLLDKYDANYVYIWQARGEYGLVRLPTWDERCLVRVFPTEVYMNQSELDTLPLVLERRCTIQVEG